MTVIECETVYGGGAGGPCCYVLRIEEVWILLDCGWDESFDVKLLEPLRTLGPKCTMVLISHFDMRHAGALPFLVKHCALTAPVFCVEPAFFMGQWALLDAYTAAVERNSALRAALSARDIVDAFAWCTRCRYDQPLVLPPAASDLTVDAIAAGRLLGGALWRVRRDVDEIVYAVDFSQEADRFLPEGATRLISNGAVIITDASHVDMQRVPRTQRDHRLLEAVLSALRRGGDVLLPCDTGGRALELLLVLDQEWGARRVDYPLVLASTAGSDALRSASQLLSWMHPDLVDQLSQRRHNAFEGMRRRLRFATTAGEALAVRSPKVVLATSASLDAGLAHALLPSWLERPDSAVVLTSRGAPGSIARSLTDAAMRRRAAPSLRIRRVRRVAGARPEATRGGPTQGGGAGEAATAEEGEEEEGAEVEGEEGDGETAAAAAARRGAGSAAGGVEVAEEDSAGGAEGGREGDDGFGVSSRVLLARADLTDGNQRCAFPTFPVPYGPRGVSAYGEELPYAALIRAARAAEVSRATPGTTVLQRVQEEEVARGGGATRSGVLRVGQASTDGGRALQLAQAAERLEGAGQVEELEVTLRCGVQFVPMDGCPDGQSLRVLLGKLEPRAVVLTQQPEGSGFEGELREALTGAQVVGLAAAGEGARRVETQTQTVTVLIHSSFVAGAALQRVGEYTLAVSGPGSYDLPQGAAADALPVLHGGGHAGEASPEPRTARAMEEEDEEEEEEGEEEDSGDEWGGAGRASEDEDEEMGGSDGEPGGGGLGTGALAQVLASARAARMPGREALRALAAPAVMARRQDLPLRRIRGLLSAAGVPVEMKEGKLYTEHGLVVTRSGEEGTISLEGPPTDQFYRVRELLLGKFVLV